MKNMKYDYKKIITYALGISLLFNSCCNNNKQVYCLPPEKIKIEEVKELKRKK